MKVRVTNIQRFSLHDGPGIRTTVFLKGCNLHCPWCANPENIDYEITKYHNDSEEGTFGYDIELDDLLTELLKDKDYYKINNGGVTFSGGEPLLQFKTLEPLLKKLKELKINIAIETALQVPTELVQIALKYIDKFIIDMKILDPEENKRIIGGNTDLYKNNIKLVQSTKKIDLIRIPLSNEYTLKENNINIVLDFLKEVNPLKVEIFKIHNLAESKYKLLERELPIFSKVDDKEVNKVYNRIKELGLDVEIIKI